MTEMKIPTATGKEVRLEVKQSREYYETTFQTSHSRRKSDPS
jgi:hypothetical protein